MPLSEIARRYEQLVLDLDGCVWVGGQALPGAVDAITALRDAGKRVAFVTNNPREPGEEYVRRLWRIGVKASLADVVTVGGALQHLLQETQRGRTAFVIGSESLRRHVADAGLKVLNGTDLASRADVVVVAGTDAFDYGDLRDAVFALRRGAHLLATSRDRTYPMPDGPWPGAGALVVAVEYASERTATIVGKPEPRLILTALDRLGDGATLVVGDSLSSDIGAAAKAGVDSALVLTGATTRDEADAAPDPRPKFVADSLAALVLEGFAATDE